ncbi:MAG: flagellar hook-basal body complex protein FliE [Bdellovibrionales bacterium]
MPINSVFNSPLGAYQKAQGLQGAGSGGDVAPGATNFADVLANFTQDTVETLKKGEQATQLAAQGKADITDVVMAVSNAELTLQTIVAVRDRVINAYQDIIRMPI